MRNRSSFKNGGAGYKNRYKLFSLLLAFILVTVFMPKTEAAAANTLGNSGVTPEVNDYKNFSYTGGVQTFTAPVSGIYKLEVWGAQGGNADRQRNDNKSYAGAGGGAGGYSVGYINIQKGDTLYIVVGQYPKNNSGPSSTSYYGSVYNGGGAGGGENDDAARAAGGGATHIATTNRGVLSNYRSHRSEVLIVAGGGGGGAVLCVPANENNKAKKWDGGAGGGKSASGTANYMYNSNQYPEVYENYNYALPSAANQSSGYAFGQGGDTTDYGGGGGGGWYGGRAGNGHQGGGGGSGYIGGVPSFTWGGTTYSPSTSNGVNSGSGRARITFISPPYYIEYKENIANAATTASGAVGNMPDPNPDYYTGSGLTGTFTVSETVPARDGYTFAGWKATDADSDGTTGRIFTGGDTITLDAN